jgi:hypothetical protein
MNKTTGRIVLFEPDVDALQKALADREVSPDLGAFLHGLLKRKKWARKINLPSGHDDVAVVLVFTTTLKEAGLEIFSELHVFFAGKIIVEKWQIVGEGERIALLPKEIFRAIDIAKVRVEGLRVSVEFRVPPMGRQSSETLVKTFDFAGEKPRIDVAAGPLIEGESGEPPAV